MEIQVVAGIGRVGDAHYFGADAADAHDLRYVCEFIAFHGRFSPFWTLVIRAEISGRLLRRPEPPFGLEQMKKLRIQKTLALIRT